MNLQGVDLDSRCMSVRLEDEHLYFACTGDVPKSMSIVIVNAIEPNYIAALDWAVSHGHIQQEKSA